METQPKGPRLKRYDVEPNGNGEWLPVEAKRGQFCLSDDVKGLKQRLDDMSKSLHAVYLTAFKKGEEAAERQLAVAQQERSDANVNWGNAEAQLATARGLVEELLAEMDECEIVCTDELNAVVDKARAFLTPASSDQPATGGETPACPQCHGAGFIMDGGHECPWCGGDGNDRAPSGAETREKI